VLVALVSWLLGRLLEGSFSVPWTPVLLSSGALIVALFLSSVLSHTMYLSFLGEGFEQNTFAVLGSLLLGLILMSMLFTTRKRIIGFLQAFFISYIILAVFQLIHIFLPSFTSLGIFFSSSDSAIGLWGDFGFISGAALIGFVLMLQFLKPAKTMRLISIIGGILALFFVILTNIFTVWVLVGLSAISILIYVLIINRLSEVRQFSFLAFGLSLIALFFILANNLIGGMAATLLHVPYIDVHPSFSATVQVTASSLRAHPLFGIGPNRFLGEWLKYRPVAVNLHTLWDTPFTAGSSMLLTVGMLSGILGILAVLFFVLSFFYESIGKVFRNSSTGENTAGFMIFSLFILALYFVLSLLIASPGLPIVVCMFTFVGIFLGTLVEEKQIPVRSIFFLKDQRSSFFSIFFIVALLMVSAGTAYAVTERFAAFVFYQKGVRDAQTGDLAKADTRLVQAINLADIPIFERTRVLLAEQSIQKTLALPSNTLSQDSTKAVLQSAVSVGNASARQAINLDPSDPANYITFGDLLRILAPLKIDGVFSTALDTYNRAINLAPNYPKTYLNVAELYFDSGDNANARVYAKKALDAKSNYTDVFFLMSQIETAAGNSQAAVKQLQDATIIDASNPDTYFELGLLYYQNGNYSDAIGAFRSTVALNAQYLNGWYYLALADQKTGNAKEANDILTALHQRLPDNQDVSNALNGASTQTVDTSATKPTSTKQEKAKKLPLPSTTSGDAKVTQ
jgi:tetratricopeptide (TPR) repeat protein